MKGKESAELYTAYYTITEEIMAEIENGLANIKAGIEDEAFDEFYMAMKRVIEAPLSSVTYRKSIEMLEDEARQLAKTFATNMTETQLNSMAQTIADGLKEGLGTQQISRKLTMVKGLDSNRAKSFEKYVDDLTSAGVNGKKLERLTKKEFKRLLNDRRWTISQTEARVATSHARQTEAKAMGAKYKLWMTVGDDRVSEECRANQAQGPIPLADAFPSGHMNPPCHPNCRCTLGYGMAKKHLEPIHKEVEEMSVANQAIQPQVAKPKQKKIKIKPEKIDNAVKQLSKVIP